MSSQWSWILVLAGLLAAMLSASGSQALRDFSRRQLEIYLRRRRRRDLFGEILTGHDHLAVVADTAFILSLSAVLLTLGLLWAAGGLAAGGLDAGGLAAGGLDAGGLDAGGLDAGGLDAGGQGGAGPGMFRLPLAVQLAGMALVAVGLLNWIPAAITRFWSAPFLFYTWWLWKVLAAVLFPLTWCGEVAESFLGRLGGKLEDEPDDEEAFEDEIRTMVSAGQREGLLEADAREMIEGVMELADTVVSDIMTPRSNVDALSIQLPWNEVLRFVVQVGRTRIPVYDGSLDNILGILYVKDLLEEFSREDPAHRRPLRRLLRPAWFVPTAKAVDDLLRDFLETRNHMAIVVDEYRSVAGVVTIEDALEEIVGEITDESDRDHEDGIWQLNDSTAEALGRTHLEELNERLGLNLPEPEEFDTVGGLVMRQLNAIPRDGDSIVAGNVRITVLKSNRRRVERVRLETLTDAGRDELRHGPQYEQAQ
ncbi:MAG: HlyC/CorC family transporter [Pirellulaceae bacterium]|nr:HlyC/CorC family transporter [Pirellulaceae bacterium]